MEPRSLSRDDESLAHLKSLGLGEGVGMNEGRWEGLTRGGRGADRESSPGRSDCQTSRRAMRGANRESRRRRMRWVVKSRPCWKVGLEGKESLAYFTPSVLSHVYVHGPIISKYIQTYISACRHTSCMALHCVRPAPAQRQFQFNPLLFKKSSDGGTNG